MRECLASALAWTAAAGPVGQAAFVGLYVLACVAFLPGSVLTHGPQQITRHGEAVVVVLSTKEFKKLTRPKGDIVRFFSRSPLAEVELGLSRSKETARDLDL